MSSLCFVSSVPLENGARASCQGSAPALGPRPQTPIRSFTCPKSLQGKDFSGSARHPFRMQAPAPAGHLGEAASCDQQRK